MLNGASWLCPPVANVLTVMLLTRFVTGLSDTVTVRPSWSEVVIGVAIDVSLLWLSEPSELLARYGLVTVGIALVGVGSGLYLTCFLGPGPRDGLMTGISRRSGLSLRLVRTALEISALTTGAILGGTVGVGTLAFALLIGPTVQTAVVALAGRPLHDL
jgi:uncharacterized membrane protein YczE